MDEKEINPEFLQIIHEERDLQNRIQNEKDFMENKNKILQDIQSKFQKSKQRFESISNSLREAINKQSIIEYSEGKKPSVLKISNFEGQTPYLFHLRYMLHIAHLKSIILRLKERLYHLRMSTFCMDDKDNINNFDICSGVDLNDFDPTEFILPIDTSIPENKIKLSFSEKLKNITIDECENELHINLIKFQPQEPVIADLSSVPQFHLSSTSITPPNLQNEFIEIQRLFNSQSNQQLQNNEINIAKTVNKITSQLQLAKQTLNSLARESNSGISSKIWTTEKIIHNKMFEITKALNKSLEKVLINNEISVKPFGYREPNPIVVKVPDESETNHFKSIDSEIESTITSMKQINENDINSAKQIISSFEKPKNIVLEEEEEEEICDFIEKNKEIIEIREKILNQQKEALQKLTDLIGTLPENVNEFKVNPNIQKRFTIELPSKIPLNDTTEKTEQNQLIESNRKIFNDFIRNNNDLTEISIPDITQTVKYSENQRFKNIVEKWKEKLQESSMDNYTSLLAKRKEELTEELASWESKFKAFQRQRQLLESKRESYEANLQNAKERRSQNLKQYEKFVTLNKKLPLYKQNLPKIIENLEKEIWTKKIEIRNKEKMKTRWMKANQAYEEMMKEMEKLQNQIRQHDDEVSKKK